MQKTWGVLFLAFAFCAQVAWADAVQFFDDVHFQSADKTQLSANIFLHTDSDKKFPTLIFVNSWTLEEHEYLLKAREFANRGYNVFSYSARGWGSSEGYANVAGPKDMEDLAAAIDWLIENTNADPQRFGMAGISYGGGMSLMASALEPRIKVVASMSGWANLNESLFPGSTANQLWSKLLLYSGKVTGRLPSEIKKHIADLNAYRNLDQIETWAEQRSAETFLKRTNANGTPIMIVNNWSDGLFNPSSIIDYFGKLKTPKKLILEEGIHASGEIGDLIGLERTEGWKAVQKWFDYWLLGKENGILQSPEVRMQIRHSEKFQNFSEGVVNRLPLTRFDLQSTDAEAKSGDILLTSRKNPKLESLVSFASGDDSGASTGVPLIGAFLDAHFDLSVSLFWPKLSSDDSISFVAEELNQDLKLRGPVQLELNLKSTHQKQTVVAYLYDLNAWGYAKLITHGVQSFENSKKDFQNVKVDLFAVAYDLPKGHRLALVVDTVDEVYKEFGQGAGQIQVKFGPTAKNRLGLTLSP